MPPVPVLLVLMLAAWARATDYCAVCSDHTMCQFPTEGPADSCPKLLEQGVTAEEKEKILAAHNALRMLMSQLSVIELPAAQAMPNLTWSEELATVAQRWAYQCNFKHDACRDLPNMKVGQNLATQLDFFGEPHDWLKEAVSRWMAPAPGDLNEMQVYGYLGEILGNLTFTKHTENIGANLTQIIWAKTTTIGCGYAAFEDIVFENAMDTSLTFRFVRRYYVCNYGPAGNVIGEQIYLPA